MDCRLTVAVPRSLLLPLQLAMAMATSLTHSPSNQKNQNIAHSRLRNQSRSSIRIFA
jgi:hypothetical protein